MLKSFVLKVQNTWTRVCGIFK